MPDEINLGRVMGGLEAVQKDTGAIKTMLTGNGDPANGLMFKVEKLREDTGRIRTDLDELRTSLEEEQAEEEREEEERRTRFQRALKKIAGPVVDRWPVLAAVVGGAILSRINEAPLWAQALLEVIGGQP